MHAIVGSMPFANIDSWRGETEELFPAVLCLQYVHVTSNQLEGNKMIGLFTCNFHLYDFITTVCKIIDVL